MRWLFFDNHTFTNNYAMYRVQNCMTPQAADPAVLAFLRLRVESAFSIAEKHFKDSPFVVGDTPSIVDFSMAGYVFYPAAETGFDSCGRVSSYRCLAWARCGAARLEAALRTDAGRLIPSDTSALDQIQSLHRVSAVAELP